ncbi:MAG: dolichyl-phosphate beta-glucosyltransferase [Chloroflexota bacterium]|nr:glycosyltransferase family 2 protein [Chloroflexota bacterium]
MKAEIPMVDIVIPVYNEEAQLEQSVKTLYNYLQLQFPYTWRITIADNASQDQTWKIAQHLEQSYPGQVRALHLDQKGRGRALRYAWLSSDAQIVSYMDVDLSTDLNCLLPLIAPLASGHSQIAIGSRLARGAKVERQWKREVISRGYNLLIKLVFGPVFSDAQCGFKAVRRELLLQMLPEIENNEWFFDSEMLLLAEQNNIRIHEVAVDWVEDLDTRVNIKWTVTEDLKGLWRMRLKFWRGGGLLPLAKESIPSARQIQAA